MSLEFVLGTGASDPLDFLLEKTAHWLAENPKNQVFYIVPNHIKFETEIEVLAKMQKKQPDPQKSIATMRLQVFSLSRLAWYYLQNTPYYNNHVITETGSAMLIRKILLEEEDSLKVFRGEANKSGFIEKLTALFHEFQVGNVELNDLERIIQSLEGTLKGKDCSVKLQDFFTVYEKYEALLIEKGFGFETQMKGLLDFLQTQDLEKSMFIFLGYSHLNAQELQLVDRLFQKGATVKFFLTLDKGDPFFDGAADSFFFDSKLLYQQVYQAARKQEVRIYQDVYTKPQKSIQSELISLGDYWQESHDFSSSVGKKGAATLSMQEVVQIWSGETVFSEVSHVAREIRRLVSQKEYRYQDIRILVRDFDLYKRVVPSVFKAQAIPFYFDQEMSMKHHPLVAFFESLFAIDQGNYRYRDVMRFLRTELFFPQAAAGTSLTDWQHNLEAYREKVDVTENVVLSHGFEGYFWTQSKDWHFTNYQFEENEVTSDENQLAENLSNEIRQEIRKFLPPFYAQLKKAQTGLDAAKCLYQFVEKIRLEDQMILWRNQEVEAGDLDKARIHEQTWQAFIDLMDEYVELLGDSAYVQEDFAEIFTSGLENKAYHRVPTAIDQVAITSMDLVHMNKSRIVFIIGLTDQVLPQKIENKTLLSDEERYLIDENLADEKYLQNSAKAAIAREPFIAYLAFMSAKERLYLTYPSSSDNKKDLKISPYLEQLIQGLKITVQNKAIAPLENNTALEDLTFISTYRSLVTDLTVVKRQVKELKIPLSSFWQNLERLLLEQPEYSELTARVLGSLTAQNVPEKISGAIVDELYGHTIFASVSRIESFYQCEYKYWLNYGLRLKEREVFEFSPAAAGDFFHEALDQLFKTLISEKLQLSLLTPDEIQRVTEEVLQKVLRQERFMILQVSNRMNYIRYQLSATIRRVSWALKKQSERSGLSTIQTEVLFGQIAQNSGLDSYDFPLENNHELKIRGKIDRIDQLEMADKTFLAVVDYKSSAHSFDFREAYFGLAMQMITYLDITLKNAVALTGKSASGAGAFYLHVKNPLLDGKKIAFDQAEEKILENFRYEGILADDEELLEHLDQTLAPKNSSAVYPYRQTGKGDYTSNRFVDQEELSALLSHNRLKFQEAGNKILSGKIALNPAYKDKQRIACSYCPFRSVCQFDVMLKENEYHRIEKMKKEEVFARIKEEDQTDGSGTSSVENNEKGDRFHE